MAVTKLNNVRLSFPALFIAEAFKPGDPPRFRASFLIEKGSDTDKEIRAAMLAAVKESKAWKGVPNAEKALAAITANPNKCCYQDGDTKEYDGYEGMMALTANTKTRPLVIDADKSILVEADGKPYAGCYVNASIEFFGYDNTGKGISAQLRGVQFLRDGDAFAGGGAASAAEFDVVEGADADAMLA
jgi:hypothetical protein